MRVSTFSLTLVGMLLSTPSAWSAIQFDQNVTNNVIMGTGISNGSFTTDRDNGIELGLRAKLRHNATGIAENTFNSNGDGTYSFDAGVAPTQAFPTAVWSFEWSINSNFDNSGTNLFVDDGAGGNSLTYALSYDSDPSLGVSWSSFDPINLLLADHSIGNNATAQSGGSEAGDALTYATLLAGNNLAQNSWKAHWFLVGFDPTLDATYDFKLEAFGAETGLLASTSMQVIVGAGGAVPEPVSLIVWTLLGTVGITVGRRCRRSA